MGPGLRCRARATLARAPARDSRERLATQPTRALGLIKRAFNASLGATSRRSSRSKTSSSARRAEPTTTARASAPSSRSGSHVPGTLMADATNRRRRGRRRRDGKRASRRWPPPPDIACILGDANRGRREGADEDRRSRSIAMSRRAASTATRRRARARISRCVATWRRASALAACGLVIEAVVEDLGVKRALFAALEEVVARRCDPRDEHVVALGRGDWRGDARMPSRVVGMHFFNPAPLMPLVEIVPAITTSTRGRGAHARTRRRLGEDDCRRDGHAGFHRQSRRAPVLRRGAAHPRGRASPTSPRSTGRCARSADFAWDRSS